MCSTVTISLSYIVSETSLIYENGKDHVTLSTLHLEFSITRTQVLVMHTFCHGQPVYQSEVSSFPRCKDRKLKNLQNGMIWG